MSSSIWASKEFSISFLDWYKELIETINLNDLSQHETEELIECSIKAIQEITNEFPETNCLKVFEILNFFYQKSEESRNKLLNTGISQKLVLAIESSSKEQSFPAIYITTNAIDLLTLIVLENEDIKEKIQQFGIPHLAVSAQNIILTFKMYKNPPFPLGLGTINILNLLIILHSKKWSIALKDVAMMAIDISLTTDKIDYSFSEFSIELDPSFNLECDDRFLLDLICAGLQLYSKFQNESPPYGIISRLIAWNTGVDIDIDFITFKHSSIQLQPKLFNMLNNNLEIPLPIHPSLLLSTQENSTEFEYSPSRLITLINEKFSQSCLIINELFNALKFETDNINYYKEILWFLNGKEDKIDNKWMVSKSVFNSFPLSVLKLFERNITEWLCLNTTDYRCDFIASNLKEFDPLLTCIFSEIFISNLNSENPLIPIQIALIETILKKFNNFLLIQKNIDLLCSKDEYIFSLLSLINIPNLISLLLPILKNIIHCPASIQYFSILTTETLNSDFSNIEPIKIFIEVITTSLIEGKQISLVNQLIPMLFTLISTPEIAKEILFDVLIAYRELLRTIPLLDIDSKSIIVPISLNLINYSFEKKQALLQIFYEISLFRPNFILPTFKIISNDPLLFNKAIEMDWVLPDDSEKLASYLIDLVKSNLKSDCLNLIRIFCKESISVPNLKKLLILVPKYPEILQTLSEIGTGIHSYVILEKNSSIKLCNIHISSSKKLSIILNMRLPGATEGNILYLDSEPPLQLTINQQQISAKIENVTLSVVAPIREWFNLIFEMSRGRFKNTSLCTLNVNYSTDNKIMKNIKSINGGTLGKMIKFQSSKFHFESFHIKELNNTVFHISAVNRVGDALIDQTPSSWKYVKINNGRSIFASSLANAISCSGGSKIFLYLIEKIENPESVTLMLCNYLASSKEAQDEFLEINGISILRYLLNLKKESEIDLKLIFIGLKQLIFSAPILVNDIISELLLKIPGLFHIPSFIKRTLELLHIIVEPYQNIININDLLDLLDYITTEGDLLIQVLIEMIIKENGNFNFYSVLKRIGDPLILEVIKQSIPKRKSIPEDTSTYFIPLISSLPLLSLDVIYETKLEYIPSMHIAIKRLPPTSLLLSKLERLFNGENLVFFTILHLLKRINDEKILEKVRKKLNLNWLIETGGNWRKYLFPLLKFPSLRKEIFLLLSYIHSETPFSTFLKSYSYLTNSMSESESREIIRIMTNGIPPSWELLNYLQIELFFLHSSNDRFLESIDIEHARNTIIGLDQRMLIQGKYLKNEKNVESILSLLTLLSINNIPGTIEKINQIKIKISRKFKKIFQDINFLSNEFFEKMNCERIMRNHLLTPTVIEDKFNEFEINQFEIYNQRRYVPRTIDNSESRIDVIKIWTSLKHSLEDERGAFESHKEHKWKLDRTENDLRMHPRLKRIPEYEFNSHINASRSEEGSDAREYNKSESQDSTGESDIDSSQSIYNIPEEKSLEFNSKVIKLGKQIPGIFLISRKEIGFQSSFKSWNFKKNQIQKILSRRFLQRWTGIEIFLNNRKSIYLDFGSKRIQKQVIFSIKKYFPSIQAGNPQKYLNRFTKAWISREISNFEYLMALNTLSGRSYNDISQYPIFPWILADYKSNQLNLNEDKTFRDLSKPLGSLYKESKKIAIERFNALQPPDIPFHYGTHYSTPHIVYFLIRLEPFTSLSIEIQGGLFDRSDRIFHEIEATWNLVVHKSSMVLELIPEFFYLPEMFINLNDYSFGQKQSGEDVEDVILPPWAKNPNDFIKKHREALESEYVSSHLNEWIDLIFGYKQTGEEAINATNVFYPMTYENYACEALSKGQRGALDQIRDFGQTPIQLFTSPHPLREKIKIPKIQIPNIQIYSTKISTYPLVYVSFSTPLRLSDFFGISSQIICIDKVGTMYSNSWIFENGQMNVEIDPHPAERMLKTRSVFSENEAPVITVNESGSVLYVGGFMDNTLRCFGVNSHGLIQRIERHKDYITCIANDDEYLATGSKDTTVIIWKKKLKGTIPIEGKYSVCYGHNGEVLALDISESEDLVASGSKNSILLHSLHTGRLIRIFEIEGDPIMIKIKQTKIIIYTALIYWIFSVNGVLLKKIPSPRFLALSWTFVNDLLIAGGRGGSIDIRRIDDLSIIDAFAIGKVTTITSISVEPNGRNIYCSTAEALYIVQRY